MADSVPSGAVPFLQWALPRLRLRWRGFRRVHRQVWRRVRRRMRELGLAHEREYREYLEGHAAEWDTLDSFCRITISRLRRDRVLFDALASLVLPGLAAGAVDRGDAVVRAWSAGCASGEEAYSLRILWELEAGVRFPNVSIEVFGTDADPRMVERARVARYSASSLREVPPSWRASALDEVDGEFEVRERFRDGVRFAVADIRAGLPDETFDLVLCRHVVFTYFDAGLQAETTPRIASRLRAGGVLGVGLQESLPAGVEGFAGTGVRGLYRRIPGASVE